MKPDVREIAEFPFSIHRGAFKDVIAVNTKMGTRFIVERSCYDEDGLPTVVEILAVLRERWKEHSDAE